MKKVFSDFLITFVCLIIIVILIIFFGLKVFFQDDALTKEDVFDIVTSKYDTIISDMQKGEFSESEKIKGIIKVKTKGDTIDFACEGKGNVVSGVYCGFYYAEDNLPKVSFLDVLFTEKDLKPINNGYCFDKYDYYYTEKIRDKIYYYEYYY